MAQAKFALPLTLLLLLLLGAVTANAQGCSSCRDATAGSAPRAREGMRRAILVLGLPAAALFIAVFVLAYRIESRREV